MIHEGSLACAKSFLPDHKGSKVGCSSTATLLEMLCYLCVLLWKRNLDLQSEINIKRGQELNQHHTIGWLPDV